jgi:alkylation response protein AidB-like acyl-CoA dehydrogenase
MDVATGNALAPAVARAACDLEVSACDVNSDPALLPLFIVSVDRGKWCDVKLTLALSASDILGGSGLLLETGVRLTLGDRSRRVISRRLAL